MVDWGDHGDLDKPIQEAVEHAPQIFASRDTTLAVKCSTRLFESEEKEKKKAPRYSGFSTVTQQQYLDLDRKARRATKMMGRSTRIMRRRLTPALTAIAT